MKNYQAQFYELRCPKKLVNYMGICEFWYNWLELLYSKHHTGKTDTSSLSLPPKVHNHLKVKPLTQTLLVMSKAQVGS